MRAIVVKDVCTEWPERMQANYKALTGKALEFGIKRDNHTLVKVAREYIEWFGEDNGEIQIFEVPAEMKWVVMTPQEYGMEWVAEAHKFWGSGYAYPNEGQTHLRG